MKKLIVIVASLLVCSSVFAAKPIKVISGSMPSFEKGNTAVLLLDMSNTTWEDKETVKHHFDEYDKLLESIADMFRISYNRSSGSLKIVDESDTVNYRLILRPDNFFARVGTLWKKEVFVWGTIDIADATSNDVLCTIQLTKFKAKEGDYVEADAVVKCMSDLAESLAKL